LLPRSTRAPRAARPTVASLAAFLLALPFACDSAFKGGTTTAGSGASLTFEFGGGGSQSDAVQGDPVELKILVPRIGFARLLDPITLSIYPARLELTADRAIGDPAQGGFAAGESLTQFAIAQGWTSVLEPPGTVREIHVAADTATPLLFPAGLMHLSLGVTDDVGRSFGPFVLELTVISAQRPTVVVRCEIPPSGTAPTGVSLPLDGDGRPLLGDRRPFALTVTGIPNPTTGEPFTRVLGAGGIDPARLVVTADHDLGDPAKGGILAGTNLAPSFATDLDFVVDPVTGGFTTGMLFPADATFAAALGTTTFTATVLDDADVPSDPQAVGLDVVPRTTLAANVQPILSGHCGFQCHDGDFPILDMNLSDGQTFSHVVNVRAVETPDDSCATLRVAPYDAEASYLFRKVSGTHLGDCAQGSGDQMPPGLPLGADDRATIEQWILQGAFDD
jgi:hypothetical protein